eukprot:c12197_g2_i2.p1 GENE.c12197_g2_i2~~c12197_g2_i2.p1  ORF type:complete len:714 (-),score=241.45 c12197_g2_i2:282-2423(-)
MVAPPLEKRQFTFHSKRLFTKLDDDQSGSIGVDELRTHLDISEQEAEAMILETKTAKRKKTMIPQGGERNDPNHNGGNASRADDKKLTFEEFNHLLKVSFGAVVADNEEMSDAEIKRYRAMFDAIDKDQSGSISVKELLDGMDEDEAREFLEAANIDEDGELTFDHFLALMAHSSHANARALKDLLKTAPALQDLTAEIELQTIKIPETILSLWMQSQPDGKGLVFVGTLQVMLDRFHQSGELECSEEVLLTTVGQLQEHADDNGKVSFEIFWHALADAGVDLEAMAVQDTDPHAEAQDQYQDQYQVQSQDDQDNMSSWFVMPSVPNPIDAVKSAVSTVLPGVVSPPAANQPAVPFDEHDAQTPPSNLRELKVWLKATADEEDAATRLVAIMQAMAESEEAQTAFLAIMEEANWSGFLALLSITSRFNSAEVFEHLLQLVYVVGVLQPKAFSVVASQGFLRVCQRLVREDAGGMVGMLALHMLNAALAPDTSGLQTLGDAQIDATPEFVFATAQLAIAETPDDDDDGIAEGIAHEALCVLLRLESDHGKETGFVVIASLNEMGDVGRALLDKIVMIASCSERGKFSVDDQLQCWRCIARILCEPSISLLILSTEHTTSLISAFVSSMATFNKKEDIPSELNPELQCAMLFVIFGLYSGLESQPADDAFSYIADVKKALVEAAIGDAFEQRVAILAVSVGVQLDKITKHLPEFA